MISDVKEKGGRTHNFMMVFKINKKMKTVLYGFQLHWFSFRM